MNKLFCNCLLLLTILLMVKQSLAVGHCNVTRKWRLQKLSFPKDFEKTEVKLVAFLAASCKFCREQSIL